MKKIPLKVAIPMLLLFFYLLKHLSKTTINNKMPIKTTQQNITTYIDSKFTSKEVKLNEQKNEHNSPAEPALDLSASWNLILVNYNHPIDNNYINNIVLKPINKSKQLVDERILNYVNQMLEDSKKDGIDLLVCSGFRSIKRQTWLFNTQVEREMANGKSREAAEEGTASWIARPYTSEHHTGLALDIVTPSYQTLNEGFFETDAYTWLKANCTKYGFIIRYQAGKEEITKVNPEPWHVRFVGAECADAIKKTNQCLEEYLDPTTNEKP
ncbi:MAG: M15 family metallopeptidase [Oscillospiraceae bacterium]|jgi:D-alanyl-D-alanine carboxypeptidase|nr:M15 family metallopeptidase [Oscillospiraceae bacterium]